MKELRDKLVLVTGAAGGIGLATAEAFAREGCRLALMDIDGDRLIDARERVKTASLNVLEPLALAVDLTDADALAAAFEHLCDARGNVDILVNNAGVCAGGRFHDLPAQHIDPVINTNLVAPLQLCHRVIPPMLAQGSGHIVNIYSSSASLAVPGFVTYAASKGGLATATRILRRELSGSGIDLTLLCPGSIHTPMSDAMIATGKGPGAMPQSRPEVPAAAVVEAVKFNKRLVMVSQSPLMQRITVLLDKIFPALLDNYWVGQADTDYYFAASTIGTRSMDKTI